MLRLVRSDPERARFDGAFFRRDALFWPIARAATVFAGASDWPAVSAYAALGAEVRAGVRFVEQKPPKAPKPVRRVEDLYDACIVRGEVPTRERSWHDYLNALVWVAFPSTKRALHARQHAVVSRWLVDHGAIDDAGVVAKLPNARTREHDALALLDEGGVAIVRHAGGVRYVPFGHALFEGLVMGTPSMVARGVDLVLQGALPHGDEDVVACVDALLAERIEGPLSPDLLPRVPLDQARA